MRRARMAFLEGPSVSLVGLDPEDDAHVEAFRRTRTDALMRETGWYGGALTPGDAREQLESYRDRDQEQRCAIEVQAGEDAPDALVATSGRAVAGWARASIRDDRARRGDVGYYVLPEYQRDGYATEATALLCEYAFDEMNAHKLEAWVLAGNDASARVVETLGFNEEATVRDRMYRGGDYRDSVLYDCTSDEFDATDVLADT